MATFLSYIILFSLHFQKFVGFLERSHSWSAYTIRKWRRIRTV